MDMDFAFGMLKPLELKRSGGREKDGKPGMNRSQFTVLDKNF